MRLFVVALLVVVTGCTSDTASPPASPTPSGTPPPTRQVLSVPQLPAMAATHTPAGIGAFVGYYVDVISHAVRTGTTRTLRDLATPQCKTCNDIASSVEEVYDGGGFIETDGWELDNFEIRSFDGDAVVELTVMQAPALTYASASDEPSATPRQTSTLRLRLVPQRVGWLVARMDVRSR